MIYWKVTPPENEAKLQKGKEFVDPAETRKILWPIDGFVDDTTGCRNQIHHGTAHVYKRKTRLNKGI
jgi:hypothetical protein